MASGCLINGKCVGDNQADPSNPCQVCAAKKSSTAYTFVSGQICTPSSGTPSICAATKCRSVQSDLVDTGAKSIFSVLGSVAYVPADKKFWALGITDTGAGGSAALKGVLLDAATGLTSSPVIKLTDNRLNAIHTNLAVGSGGTHWRHDTKAWVKAAGINSVLGSMSRAGVWGASHSSGVEVYYLTGEKTSTHTAINKCTISSGKATCVDLTGVSGGQDVAYISGVFSGTSLGPIWASPQGSNAPEDIYYNAANLTSWTRSSPHGCQDHGNSNTTACSNTSNTILDLYAVGPKNVWVVGTSGLILRYDGSKWTRITGAWSSQNSYDITAVYGSDKEQLVSLVTSRTSIFSGRRVQLFSYNMELDKWMPPLTLSQASWQAQDKVNDMAGQDYNPLWLVGTKRTGSGSSAKELGWVMKLE